MTGLSILFVTWVSMGGNALGASEATCYPNAESRAPDPPPAPNPPPEWPVGRPHDALRIHFLDVGPGLCVLMECPSTDARERAMALVDCGSKTPNVRYSLSPESVKAYLDRYLDQATEYSVYISHADVDHYNYLRPYVNRRGGNRPIRVVYGGTANQYRCTRNQSFFPQNASGPPSSPALLEARDCFDDEGGLSESGADWCPTASEATLPSFACGTAKIVLLTAPRRAWQGDAAGTNSRSLVLSVEHGDFRALFPGDAWGVTEEAASRNSGRWHDVMRGRTFDLMASAHHGTSQHESNTRLPGMVNGRLPQRSNGRNPVVVFSSGARGSAHQGQPRMKYGHPRTEVVERFDPDWSPSGAAPSRAKGHPLVSCGNVQGDTCVEGRTTKQVYSTAMQGTIVITSRGDATEPPDVTYHKMGAPYGPVPQEPKAGKRAAEERDDNARGGKRSK